MHVRARESTSDREGERNRAGQRGRENEAKTEGRFSLTSTCHADIGILTDWICILRCMLFLIVISLSISLVCFRLYVLLVWCFTLQNGPVREIHFGVDKSSCSLRLLSPGGGFPPLHACNAVDFPFAYYTFITCFIQFVCRLHTAITLQLLRLFKSTAFSMASHSIVVVHRPFLIFLFLRSTLISHSTPLLLLLSLTPHFIYLPNFVPQPTPLFNTLSPPPLSFFITLN